DSFTNQLPYSWANRIEAHGWSVISASASVDSLLSSPEFQSKPPRVVVYAVVERSLKQSLADGKPCVAPSALAPSTALALPTPKPRTATTSTVTQPERALPDSDQITYARDFLVNSVRLAFRSKQYATQLYALKETRFSNVRSKDLLVLSGDLAKSGWTETDIATMRCRLLEYRAQIEANGRTRFVYLPIPDKLSAYHADLIDPSPPRSVLPELIQPGVESPRLDLALRSAIEEGQIDVYLPSDTHWGTNGYRVAADTVIELLTALSLKAK
ncbi:MAG: hypothetical protein NTX56_14440, partial [Proteobacteria bacterium]|nr:hypothetical protein [Pseudomonadota bacterium]